MKREVGCEIQYITQKPPDPCWEWASRSHWS